MHSKILKSFYSNFINHYLLFRMKYLGQAEIIEYGLSIAKSSDVPITPLDSQHLATTILQFMNKQITLDQASDMFKSVVGTSRPIEAISDIIEESHDPNPLMLYVFDKKMPRHWSAHEDTRLLAGVYIYGANDWKAIANFVGANRGRAQCLQRWTRTLKPSITKDMWTPEEDAKLCQIIAQTDKLSWTKVAHIMGNRSDVQCRYHFSQLIKNNAVEFKNVPIYGTNQFKQIPVLVNQKNAASVTAAAPAPLQAPLPSPPQAPVLAPVPNPVEQIAPVQPVSYAFIPSIVPCQPIYGGISYIPSSPQALVQRPIEQTCAPIHIDSFLSCFAH